MNACIDSIGDSQVFSTLDVSSGSWYIEADRDREKIASTFLHVSYEFMRMPSGVKSTATTFQQLSEELSSTLM